jgi:hypothetical protein
MTKSNNASITVGTSVVIESLEVKDPQVIAAVQAAKAESRDLPEYMTSAIEIGVKALQATGVNIGIDQLTEGISNAEKTMTKAATALSKEISEKIENITGTDGILDTKLAKVIDDFTKDIEGLTASEKSPIREGIKTQMADMAKKLMDDFARETKRQKTEIEQLLDPANAASPLRALADKMDLVTQSVQGVKEEMQQSTVVAKVIENSAHSGLPYEDQVITSIQMIAGLAGDDCFATGKSTGNLPGRYSGDGVVDLKSNGDKVKARLVLEAKNTPMDKKAWEKEITDGKANRDATGFIGFSKHIEDMPNKNRIMIVDRQTMILAFDPEKDDLQLALIIYQIVKMNTLASSGALEENKVSEINDELERAFKSLKKFDSLTKSAKTIENSAKGMYGTLKEMKGEMLEHLNAIQGVVDVDLAPLELESADLLELEEGDSDE